MLLCFRGESKRAFFLSVILCSLLPHAISFEGRISGTQYLITNSGRVFVFSGILPICDGEDGLAAVLGHEIAHNVAHQYVFPLP